MEIEKGKVRFSLHSLKRAEQYHLSVHDLLNAWYQSTNQQLSKREQAWKFARYGMESLDDFYQYHAPSDILFTCHKNKDLTTVITVTRKRELKRFMMDEL